MREFVIQCGSGQCIRGKNRSVHTVIRWLLERLISTPYDILWGKARQTRPRLRSHHRSYKENLVTVRKHRSTGDDASVLVKESRIL